MMKEERTPLLSDQKLNNMLDWSGDSTKRQMENVRDFYEAKITRGELMVVKTTKNCNSATGWFTCLNCGATMANAYYSYPPHHSEHGGRIDFCPGCGAKIVP